MQNYVKKPDLKYIKESIDTDILFRNSALLNFVDTIYHIKNGIISIEGEWGSGKTFFVKQLEYLYGNYVNIKNLKNGKFGNIQLDTFIEKNDKFQNTNIFYFNAWEYDGTDEPLKALIYKLIEQYNYFTGDKKVEFDAKEFVNKTMDKVSEKYKVFALFQILLESLNYKDNEIDNYIKCIKENIDKKEIIKEIISNIKQNKKLVIIIDELDRCKPNFALKLLEEIKHYFDIENLVFILAINPRELECIIKKYYGENFDGLMYLNKIIDLRTILPPIDKHNYLDYLLSKQAIQSKIRATLDIVIDYYKFEMREIGRLLNLIEELFPDYNVCQKTYEEYNSLYDVAKSFVLSAIPIILVATALKDINLYYEMIDMKSLNVFIDMAMNENFIITFHLGKKLLEDDVEGDIKNNAKKHLEHIYYKIFDNTPNNLGIDQLDIRLKEIGKRAIEKSSILTGFDRFLI